MRAGSCGQDSVYVRSSWPPGSKVQITKSCIVQMTTLGFRGRKFSVATEMDVTRYEVFFFYFTYFRWLLASNYSVPCYSVKTFPTGFLHIDKGNSLNIQPEICKQEWQGAHGIPEVSRAGSVDWKFKELSQLFVRYFFYSRGWKEEMFLSWAYLWLGNWVQAKE